MPLAGQDKNQRYFEDSASTLVRVIESEAELTEMFGKKDPKMLEKLPRRGCPITASGSLFVAGESGAVISAYSIDSEEGWRGIMFQIDPNYSTSGTCLDGVTYGMRGKLTRIKDLIGSRAHLSWLGVKELPMATISEAPDKKSGLVFRSRHNIYTGTTYPKVAQGTRVRAAECSLHFQIEPISDKQKIRMIRALDSIFGVFSVLLFRDMEDARRRTMVGQAGEYSTATSDSERGDGGHKWLIYHAASPAVFAHPVLFNLSFDVARSAMYLGAMGLTRFWTATKEDILDAVNNLNIGKAEKIISRNLEIFTVILNKMYGKNRAERVLELMDVGALKFFNDIADIGKSWTTNAQGARVRDWDSG